MKRIRNKLVRLVPTICVLLICPFRNTLSIDLRRTGSHFRTLSVRLAILDRSSFAPPSVYQHITSKYQCPGTVAVVSRHERCNGRSYLLRSKTLFVVKRGSPSRMVKVRCAEPPANTRRPRAALSLDATKGATRRSQNLSLTSSGEVRIASTDRQERRNAESLPSCIVPSRAGDTQSTESVDPSQGTL